jgi:hypothetical protein
MRDDRVGDRLRLVPPFIRMDKDMVAVGREAVADGGSDGAAAAGDKSAFH